MNKEDIETKAENWDYYQGLLKLNGFDGITDLLTRYKRLEQVQPPSAHELLEKFESYIRSIPEGTRCKHDGGYAYTWHRKSMKVLQDILSTGNTQYTGGA